MRTIFLKCNTIPGFPDYLVTDTGRIFSVRQCKFMKTNKRINNTGYEHVGLWFDKKQTVKSVHWCVANAFLGPSNGLHINHIDGNKRNNNLSNLEIITKSENQKHAYKIGLMKPYDRSGAKNPKAKLTEAQYLELVKLRKSGLTLKQLSKHFNMSTSGIFHACKRLITKE